MQTIRIYNRRGGLAASFTGIAYKVESNDMHVMFPEGEYLWLR